MAAGKRGGRIAERKHAMPPGMTPEQTLEWIEQCQRKDRLAERYYEFTNAIVYRMIVAEEDHDKAVVLDELIEQFIVTLKEAAPWRDDDGEARR
jgi:hypothetical protein